MPEKPPARIARAVAAFEVPSDVPHRELRAATEAAQDAAREALPSQGTVRAEGALKSARGEIRTIRFDIVASGAEADDSWKALAQESFADAFVAWFERKGYAAKRIA